MCTCLYHMLAMWPWESPMLEGLLNKSTNHSGCQFPSLSNGETILSPAYLMRAPTKVLCKKQIILPKIRLISGLTLGTRAWECLQMPAYPISWVVASRAEIFYQKKTWQRWLLWLLNIWFKSSLKLKLWTQNRFLDDQFSGIQTLLVPKR